MFLFATAGYQLATKKIPASSADKGGMASAREEGKRLGLLLFVNMTCMSVLATHIETKPHDWAHKIETSWSSRRTLRKTAKRAKPG